MSMTESGTWKIRERGTDNVLAHVKLDYREDGLYVFLKAGGTGEWEESYDAVALLFGDFGAVEPL